VCYELTKKAESGSHITIKKRRFSIIPSSKCKDIGMSCGFEAIARTEGESMKKIAEHASKAHNMKTIHPDVMGKVKKAIKE